MIIKSENIRSYVINTTDVNNDSEITLDVLDLITSLNIKRYNYQLNEVKLYPEELLLFHNLNSCDFSHFEINEEIVENLNKLEKLNMIKFDFCTNSSNIKINSKIETIELCSSDFDLLLMCNLNDYLKCVILNNIDDIDLKELSEYSSIENLTLMNCTVKNAEFLLKFNKLKKIKIIGTKIENIKIIESLKLKTEVDYSEKQFIYSNLNNY